MISDREADYLLMSGIQHYCFCRRQWALIHVEQQWLDNWRTVQGDLMHERAHDPYIVDSRKTSIVFHAIRVVSHQLKLVGECDVVEYRPSESDVSVTGYEGFYIPMPIEYKRGRSKTSDCDRLQVCAQAIALEEMYGCEIHQGCLFYGETHRREYVDLNQELRSRTFEMAEDMHRIMNDGITPTAVKKSHCRSCSLYDICQPGLAIPDQYYEIRLKELVKE